MEALTLYKANSFKERKKGKRLNGTRIELPFQPPAIERHVSVPATPMLVLSSIQTSDIPEIDAKSYCLCRLLEFLSNFCAILNRAAQPGGCKTGILSIIGCDWKLIHWYFSSQPCRISVRKVYQEIDGKRETHYRIKYEFTEGVLPELGGNYY